MPRYVILEHDHPTLHWDFMLQSGDVLRTWRLADRPAAGQAVAAEASFDHRPHYLDFEGPVSGGRGCVRRWDAGTFTWDVNEPERVVVHLRGERLRGSGVLERTEGGHWSLRISELQSE